MTISEAIIKIESRMEKDKELARTIEDMRRNTLLPLPPNHRVENIDSRAENTCYWDASD